MFMFPFVFMLAFLFRFVFVFISVLMFKFLLYSYIVISGIYGYLYLFTSVSFIKFLIFDLFAILKLLIIDLLLSFLPSFLSSFLLFTLFMIAKYDNSCKLIFRNMLLCYGKLGTLNSLPLTWQYYFIYYRLICSILFNLLISFSSCNSKSIKTSISFLFA